MFEKIKRTARYVAVILLAFAGSAGINERCYADAACDCFDGYTGRICIPNSIKNQGPSAMEEFCKEEGRQRKAGGWQNHCKLTMEGSGCGTCTVQAGGCLRP
ncbi:MAG: hypothetical protein H0X26_08145 [Alphaproteobacteria bacterium]|nr:hypothetical protein [Alphaproteobacteria bacterium]